MKASKTMIGDNGWLERTSAIKKPSPPKRPGFFGNLKRMAKEMVN
jgi:hypothetical protein